MLIEIRKVGFVNKGAMLMAQAVLDHVRSHRPDADIAVAPNPVSAPYPLRARAGFHQKVGYWRKGVEFGDLANFIPAGVRRQYGLVTNKEVDIVFDISGFGYSDSNGPGGILELSHTLARLRSDAKVVLMPQAFGPFHRSISKRAMTRALERADLVFARDMQSLAHLQDIARRPERIQLSPDFTNIVEGEVPVGHDPTDHQYALVPSHMMISRSRESTRQWYLEFMKTTAVFLQKRGLKPFFLIHEGEGDARLAADINASSGLALPIVIHDDPRVIKGIMGSCVGTIGSRFHGLVGALSQGVPSLGLGWSHKYQMLFEDYDSAEALIGETCHGEEIESRLARFVDPSELEQARRKMSRRAKILKHMTREMWARVDREVLAG
jgi:polysaccharide pyruvyl transferase WcaK-like protein